MRHHRAQGDRVGSRYVLIDELGTGGMATAWRAWDDTLQQYVCVKLADLGENVTLRQRWVTESVSRVAGPHLLGVQDWNSGQHGDYIVMRLMTGGSLGDLVDRQGPLPPGQVLEVIRQTATALQGMHRGKMLHRDIKPSNLLLEPTPAGAPLSLFVADFGVIINQRGAGVTHVASGPLGTPGFIPPEAYQLESDGTSSTPDGRTDLYALGVTAYFAATGELATATRADLTPGWRTYADTSELALDSATPGPLAELITDLMSPQPESRPRSAAAVIQRCDEIAQAGFDLGKSFIVGWALPPLPPGWIHTGPNIASATRSPAEPTANLPSEFAELTQQPTPDRSTPHSGAGKTQPNRYPATNPDQRPQPRPQPPGPADNPPKDRQRGTTRRALTIVAAGAALAIAAVAGVAMASKPSAGGTAGPSPSRATSTYSSTTPTKRSSTPPSAPSSEASFEHFSVALLGLRTPRPDRVDVAVRVCVLSATPDAVHGRTRISWEPWLLAVSGASPSSPSTSLAKLPGMLPQSKYYDTGTCAQGRIPFKITAGAVPTAVLYRNGQGDVADFPLR